MKILEHKLIDFRNLEKIEMNPSSGINLIYGENGSGKTNLIESMWLCTGLRSFRGGSRKQYIMFDRPFTKIDSNFTAFGRNQVIELVYGRSEKQRKYALNQVKKPSAAALSGNFCSVVFSPDHLELISGSPDDRRRFLDNGISQIRPHYADLQQKYQKSLIQRNHLLRETKNFNQNFLNLLEIWDESLVGFGAAIMEYRYAYISGLSKSAEKFYDGISSGKEKLEISYQSVVSIQNNHFSIREISDSYRKKLKDSLQEDQKLGYTTVGIHREDLKIKLNARSIRFYGSQGQKRSAIIAMKLAEASEIARNIGEEPVIFLDDVLSELDEGRQKYILEHIQDRQIFITGCEEIRLSKQVEGKIFEMKNGQLTEL